MPVISEQSCSSEMLTNVTEIGGNLGDFLLYFQLRITSLILTSCHCKQTLHLYLNLDMFFRAKSLPFSVSGRCAKSCTPRILSWRMRSPLLWLRLGLGNYWWRHDFKRDMNSGLERESPACVLSIPTSKYVCQVVWGWCGRLYIKGALWRERQSEAAPTVVTIFKGLLCNIWPTHLELKSFWQSMSDLCFVAHNMLGDSWNCLSLKKVYANVNVLRLFNATFDWWC